MRSGANCLIPMMDCVLHSTRAMCRTEQSENEMSTASEDAALIRVSVEIRDGIRDDILCLKCDDLKLCLNILCHL